MGQRTHPLTLILAGGRRTHGPRFRVELVDLRAVVTEIFEDGLVGLLVGKKDLVFVR